MTAEVNMRPEFDRELVAIADYVDQYVIDSEATYDTARYCLLDSIACALLAHGYPACQKHLGPLIAGTTVPSGARVLGTDYQLDPMQAAYNNGALIRWLDYNDTWLAAEWGHPSDNLGAILAVADYLCRSTNAELTVRDILTAAIKAHEIQGILALENSFNGVGLDHVILVKVASTAIATKLLGGSQQQILSALSLAFVDGQSLRTYRHAPNAGQRKSWAAGDATARAVRLAMLALNDEPGYPSALTAKQWGFYAVSFNKKTFKFNRPYQHYVMDNILFKISFPAEFHAQTAVECAIQLYPTVKHRLDDIQAINIVTHESALRIISKTGPLHNYADRDHCLQYMVAIGLLFGTLTADHYLDATASDPRIDQLREKMQVSENKTFSTDYLDPEKRSIANSIQIEFKDGSKTDTITIEYPIGHKRRRQEGIPVLLNKFKTSLATMFAAERVERINALCNDAEQFDQLSAAALMDLFVP